MQNEHQKIKNIILSAFLADSHALGVQWIYDQKALDVFLPLETLREHPPDGFHKGKGAGQLTNYGDHMLHLLRFLDSHDTFDMQAYADSWFQFFEPYRGYKDHASKTAFKRLQKSKTAITTDKFPIADMAAATRFAPFLLVTTDADKLLSLALQESNLSYRNELIDDVLRMFVPMVIEALRGSSSPHELVKKASKKSGPAAELLKQGWESSGEDTRDVVLKFGAACGVESGISILGHLVSRYPDNLFEGLKANAAGSGDIAARGIGYAMLMAAGYGISSLPASWMETLQEGDWISRAIERRYA